MALSEIVDHTLAHQRVVWAFDMGLASSLERCRWTRLFFAQSSAMLDNFALGLRKGYERSL